MLLQLQLLQEQRVLLASSPHPQKLIEKIEQLKDAGYRSSLALLLVFGVVANGVSLQFLKTALLPRTKLMCREGYASICIIDKELLWLIVIGPAFLLPQ